MGFRFRRTLQLMPGVRLNFGKTGVSTSIGPRGAKLTVGPRGITRTLGLPGTGLFHTAKIATDSTPSDEVPVLADAAEIPLPPSDLARFGVTPQPVSAITPIMRRLVWFVGLTVPVASLFVLVTIPPSAATSAALLGLLATPIVLLVALFLPSRRSLEQAEQQRCTQLAVAERDRRLRIFNDAARETELTPAAVQRLITLHAKLHLTERETGRTLPRLRRRLASPDPTVTSLSEILGLD